MKLKHSLFLILLSLLFTSSAKTQSDFTIYYRSGSNIYGITDLSSDPVLLIADVPPTVRFSNSGHYFAYYDVEGVWISRTDTWQPERVISTLPREAFALEWSPDDTRLILRVAYWPDNTDPAEQPLAYNLLTETAEPWIWGQCDHIAQHRLSGEFALICEPQSDTPDRPDQFDAIALEWGGAFSEYEPDQYEILMSGLVDNFPNPIDWGVTERGQNIVYMPENYSYVEIISLWDDGERFAFNDSQETNNFWFHFAVSPDRSMVAYEVHCPTPLGSCLQITNLSTGETIWHFEDTVRADSVYDIEWYPDNRRVVLLGANYVDFIEWREIIQVFDIETGDSVRFEGVTTTGIVVVH